MEPLSQDYGIVTIDDLVEFVVKSIIIVYKHHTLFDEQTLK